METRSEEVAPPEQSRRRQANNSSYFIMAGGWRTDPVFRALPFAERARIREEIDARFLAGDLTVFRERRWIKRRLSRKRISRATRERVFLRHGRYCAKCGQGEYLEIDHIWPVALGGGDEESNLQPMCQRCNRSKGARV